MSALPSNIVAAAKLLGVDPRADRKAFVTALDRELAQRDQADPRAAAQLQADERALDQAMKDGKITAASRANWRNALRENRTGVQAMFAAMPACASAAASDAEIRRSRANVDRPVDGQVRRDAELDAISAQVTGRPPAQVQRARAELEKTSTIRRVDADTYQATTVTEAELNAAIEADDQYARDLYAISGAWSGQQPPEPQFRVVPEVDADWNPQPKLVVNKDGTGHWENQQPDPATLGMRGSTRGDVQREGPTSA
jgi:hypothetical protein